MTVVNDLQTLAASRKNAVKTKVIPAPPALGAEIRIRELSGADQVYFSNESPEARGNRHATHALLVHIVSKAIVSDTGERYADSDEGRAVLSDLTVQALTELTNEIFELSGMTDAADESQKKDSEDTLTG